MVMNTDINYTIATYSTGRKDNYLGFQIGVTHKLTRWLDVEAQYRYLTRSSNIPGISYDDNMVLISLTVGFAHGL